jgi:hypothetical protein
MVDGQRDGLEIVDHHDVVDAEFRGECRPVEDPGAVGELQRPGADVSGPGDDGADELHVARLVQELPRRGLRRRAVGGVHDPDRLGAQFAPGHESEAGVGAADVRREQICHVAPA